MSGTKRISLSAGIDCDHLDGVGGGAAIIAFGLHLRRRVDVGHDDRAGMLRFPFPQRIRRDHVRQRTAGFQIRNQDFFRRRQDARRLGHKVDAAEDDDVRVRLRRLLGKTERISDEIRHILHLADLIIMRKDDRVPLFLQSGICSCRWLVALAASTSSYGGSGDQRLRSPDRASARRKLALFPLRWRACPA